MHGFARGEGWEEDETEGDPEHPLSCLLSPTSAVHFWDDAETLNSGEDP